MAATPSRLLERNANRQSRHPRPPSCGIKTDTGRAEGESPVPLCQQSGFPSGPLPDVRERATTSRSQTTRYKRCGQRSPLSHGEIAGDSSGVAAGFAMVATMTFGNLRTVGFKLVLLLTLVSLVSAAVFVQPVDVKSSECPTYLLYLHLRSPLGQNVLKWLRRVSPWTKFKTPA